LKNIVKAGADRNREGRDNAMFTDVRVSESDFAIGEDAEKAVT